MTKDVGILILGLIVAAMPFLGFPVGIENIVFVVSGLLIAILAFLIRGDFSFLDAPQKTESFEQNGHAGAGTDGIVEREHDQYESEEQQ